MRPLPPVQSQWLTAAANYRAAAARQMLGIYREPDAVDRRLAARFEQQAIECEERAYAHRTKRLVAL